MHELSKDARRRGATDPRGGGPRFHVDAPHISIATNCAIAIKDLKGVHMYGKGGWVFRPDHPPLPIKKLTAKQKRENAAARKEWRKKRDAILAIVKEANRKAQKFGGYIVSTEDEDYGPSFPELVPPHASGRYDFKAFTAADQAVYNYSGGEHPWRYGDEDEQELETLRAVVKAGVKVYVSFEGMSASGFPLTRDMFERDGPPVPDFINDNWWRPSH